jgi:carbon monoxide dehydrogenase subunit G
MKITEEFTVSVPVDQAWEVLTDLADIAPCMPGAQLTGFDAGVYQGKVRIKVGPVISEFAGTARFAEKDDDAHRAVIDARGKDSRGAGNASAMITAGLRADGDRTVVSVDTDLKISGKVAQFGSGMIKQVSEKLLGQFVDCLESKLAAGRLQAADPLAEEETSSPSPVEASEPAASVEATAPSASSSASAPSGSSNGSAPSAPSAPAAPVEAVPPSAPVEAAAPAAAAASPRHAVAAPMRTEQPAALDLMQLAGGSIAKRLVPVLAGIVVIVVIIYLLAR